MRILNLLPVYNLLLIEDISFRWSLAYLVLSCSRMILLVLVWCFMILGLFHRLLGNYARLSNIHAIKETLSTTCLRKLLWHGVHYSFLILLVAENKFYLTCCHLLNLLVLLGKFSFQLILVPFLKWIELIILFSFAAWRGFLDLRKLFTCSFTTTHLLLRSERLLEPSLTHTAWLVIIYEYTFNLHLIAWTIWSLFSLFPRSLNINDWSLTSYLRLKFGALSIIITWFNLLMLWNFSTFIKLLLNLRAFQTLV